MSKMICTEKIHWITKYFLFIILIHFHLCFAQDETELNLEEHEGLSWKPSRRHLLYDSSSSSMNGTELAVYLIAVFIITLISACCKYCLKNGCESTDEYSDAVVHAPPRSQNPTVPVVPSTGRRALNPPRSSSSVILPPEERGVFTVDFTGIENPNYCPTMYVPPPNYYSPTAPQSSATGLSFENPNPLLDLPPSYESVLRDQKYPKVN